MTGKGRQHRRPPRPNSMRKDELVQDCALLRLPAEIRNLIYGYALTKPDRTIELWPYAKLDAYAASEDSSDPVRQRAGEELIAKHAAMRDLGRHVYLYFRDQQDLQFVRKQLSVALLSTCRQVYLEAFSYFYGRNTFRFSDDINYTGLRRFLTTIGPRARRELQSLQIAYPDAFVSDATQFVHQAAEHYPDLHGFAEVYLEGFTSGWAFQLEDNPDMVACNAVFIGNLLRTEMRDTLKEIKFVITKANWFRADVDISRTVRSEQTVLEDQIDISFKDTPWISKLIVVETGATIFCPELYHGAAFKTCDLVMEVGSRNRIDDDKAPVKSTTGSAPWHATPTLDWESNSYGFEWEWNKEQVFTAVGEQSEEEVSYGIQELLDVFEESMAACGGKASPGPSTRPSRRLKGFGAKLEVPG